MRLLIVLGCVLLFAPARGAWARPLQEQAAAGRSAGAPVDPETRPAVRLLHARGGGVLRDTARRTGDHWEVERDGEWIALPAGMIESARAEAEVLAEWRQRKSGVRKDDGEGRLALAEWALAEGLYKEALLQLDEVLERDPDHEAALALLARDDLPIGVPRTAAPLDFAAAAPPALRERAVRQIVDEVRASADPAALDALRAELGTRLLDRNAQQRSLAALTLRRMEVEFTEAELAELLRRSVRDVSAPVRLQAALALRDAREEALLLPLFKALGSSSSAIRTHAAQTMAVMGHARAVEPLVTRLLTLQPSGGDGYSAPRSSLFVGRQIAFVQDFDVEVAQNAAIGNPEIGTLQEGASLDVSVLGVSGGGGSGGGGGYGYVQEGEALCEALERLTGASPGRTKADWQRWWTANRAQWTSGSTAPAASGQPGSAGG